MGKKNVNQQFYTQPNYTSTIKTIDKCLNIQNSRNIVPMTLCEKIPNGKSSINQETNEETMTQGLAESTETILTRELGLKYLSTVAT